MKLTIDTNTDSKEEIRKAITMLSAIVGDRRVYSNESGSSNSRNIFSDSAEPQHPAQNAFAAMFGGGEPAESGAAEGKKDDKPEEKPQVIVEY